MRGMGGGKMHKNWILKNGRIYDGQMSSNLNFFGNEESVWKENRERPNHEFQLLNLQVCLLMVCGYFGEERTGDLIQV